MILNLLDKKLLKRRVTFARFYLCFVAACVRVLMDTPIHTRRQEGSHTPIDTSYEEEHNLFIKVILYFLFWWVEGLCARRRY